MWSNDFLKKNLTTAVNVAAIHCNIENFRLVIIADDM